MVRNLLNALAPPGRSQHVALVTGLKHYLGPFEAYGKGQLASYAIPRRTAAARP